jgi:hypothetical protein
MNMTAEIWEYGLPRNNFGRQGKGEEGRQQGFAVFGRCHLSVISDQRLTRWSRHHYESD